MRTTRFSSRRCQTQRPWGECLTLHVISMYRPIFTCEDSWYRMYHMYRTVCSHEFQSWSQDRCSIRIVCTYLCMLKPRVVVRTGTGIPPAQGDSWKTQLLSFTNPESPRVLWRRPCSFAEGRTHSASTVFVYHPTIIIMSKRLFKVCIVSQTKKDYRRKLSMVWVVGVPSRSTMMWSRLGDSEHFVPSLVVSFLFVLVSYLMLFICVCWVGLGWFHFVRVSLC